MAFPPKEKPFDAIPAVLLKNKLQNPVLFPAPKKSPAIHHVYHALHHMFTTKTPQQTTAFPQNPQQKHHSTTKAKTAARQTPNRRINLRSKALTQPSE
jgi:hypothetical protein